jgi:hypothetical protein
MKTGKSMCGTIIMSVLLVAAGTTVTFAQPPKLSLDGVWAVKYVDGAESTMAVEKNAFSLKVPEVGEIKGMIQTSGDYFESILSGRQNGINFLFGYVKGGKIEGKLQEKIPCTELKKAFKNGIITVGANSCQMPFTAVRK